MRIFASVLMAIFIIASLNVMQVEAAAGYGWGYKKNSNHEIPDIGQYKELLEKYGAYYADESGEKNIYLTFDNGYEEGYTDDILDVLKDRKSTRLNSSHVAISYAVFCLKKKKTEH